MPKKTKSREDCTERNRNPIISIEGKGKESGKKIVFHNPDRKLIRKIQVDGCAVSNGKRCDWLVINEKDSEFFVELKGADISYACEQLAASINELSENPAQKLKYSFVVGSRVPPRITTTIQNLAARFKNKFNCKLIVKNRECKFDLETCKIIA